MLRFPWGPNLPHPAESPGPTLVSSSGVSCLVWSTSRPGSHSPAGPDSTRQGVRARLGRCGCTVCLPSPVVAETEDAEQPPVSRLEEGQPLWPGPWEGDTPGGRGTKVPLPALHGRVPCSQGCCSLKAFSISLKTCPRSAPGTQAPCGASEGRDVLAKASAHVCREASVFLVGALVAGIDGSLGIFSGT